MQEGADTEIKSDDGATPLYMACSDGNVVMVELLLDAGANINAKFLKGSTSPLLAAAIFGHSEVVQYLLDIGADPGARTSYGYTALHLGSMSGSLEVVRVSIKDLYLNIMVLNQIKSIESNHVENKLYVF